MRLTVTSRSFGAVNVVIRGLLGEGVAASTRFDPQVVDAFLTVLDAEAEVASTPSAGWQSG